MEKGQSFCVQKNESRNANPTASIEPWTLLELGYRVEEYSKFIIIPLLGEFYLIFRQGFTTSELFIFLEGFSTCLYLASTYT